MFVDLNKVKIYIARGVTDLRKSYSSLSALTKNKLDENPLSGHLFLFCNRRRNLLKVLYFEKNGYCLWQKRLDKDKFPWPKDGDAKQELSLEQLKWLINGIDFFKEHKNYF
jgi:transposase